MIVVKYNMVFPIKNILIGSLVPFAVHTEVLKIDNEWLLVVTDHHNQIKLLSLDMTK